MKVIILTLVAAFTLPVSAASASSSQRRAGLLALQRQQAPNIFSAPNGAKLELNGFCQRPDKKHACTKTPCCCWSTFATDKHPTYPNSDEVKGKQLCLNPPAGFAYSPEPGLTFDAGYLDTLKKANLPVYDGRRLCCLRNGNGAQEDSQRELAVAVEGAEKTKVPMIVQKKKATVPEPGEVVAAFTTAKPVEAAGLKPGEEYQTSQMEAAARAHMAAAVSLKKTVGSLSASATAIEQVNDVLANDRNMNAGKKRVAKLKKAIKDWSVRRWDNLKKLKEASK